MKNKHHPDDWVLYFAGIFSGIVLAAAITAPFWPKDEGSWFHSYQSVLGGLLALIGAIFTVFVINGQTRESRRQHDFERKRKSDAARAALQLTLSWLCDYAREWTDVLEGIKDEVQNDQTPSISKLPQIPTTIISNLKECIDFADEQSQAALKDLVKNLQVSKANLIDNLREISSKRGTIDYRNSILWSGYTHAVYIQCYANRLFSYSRFLNETPKVGVLDQTEKEAGLHGLQLQAWTHPEVWGKLGIRVDEAFLNLMNSTPEDY